MLSFGLVNVPVALFPATRKQSISFNQLRKSDYSRVRYKKVGSDGVEVGATDIVKGYEVSPGCYVVISDDELDAMAPRASRIIDISDFVRLDQIDPRHYDSSFYLVPEQGGEKAYSLLLEGMRDAGVVGVARIVKHQKEYLAAVRPTDQALTLSTMLFANEMIDVNELANYLPKNVSVSDKERNMTRALIAALVTDFKPEQYKDEYHDQVMALINRKAEGEQISVTPPGNGAVVLDLMAALEASMASIKEKPNKSIVPKNPKKKNLA